MNEAIVITGIGLATPLGLGKEAAWEKIKKGVCITAEPLPENLSVDLSCFVRTTPFVHPVRSNPDRSRDDDMREASRTSNGVNPNGLPRIFPLALSAAKEAIADSGIELSELAPERIGCSVSVSKPILTFPLNRSNSPFTIHYSLPDSVGQFLCRELKISGPTQNVVAACATGVHSLFHASRWLKQEECDIVLAGSAESSLHPLYIAGFKQMGVLSDFPCPYDARRKGFVMGEGAGVLVLERKRDAVTRRAKIYAEVSGCAIGADTTHPTAFDAEGASIERLLKRVLDSCKIGKNEVDYINLHGTGTKINDLIETKAIKKVFGKSAYKLSLSSTKGATGHLLGASGSVEAAITSFAICDQFVPPTANLEIPDPECDLDYTPKKGKNKKIEIALSLSFGFGGTIGAVVFKL